MGRLVPTGTGMERYRKIRADVDKEGLPEEGFSHV